MQCLHLCRFSQDGKWLTISFLTSGGTLVDRHLLCGGGDDGDCAGEECGGEECGGEESGLPTLTFAFPVLTREKPTDA